MSGKRCASVVLSVLLCVLLAGLMVGCGGSTATTAASQTTTTGASGTTVASGGAADLAYAQAQVAKYQQLPTWVEPGPAFDAKTLMAGKSLLLVPASSAVPFVQTIADSMAKIAGEVGLKVHVWTNQGQPTQWAQGITYGIDQKFDMIDLVAGLDPSAVAPQVEAAKAAGIKIVTSHLTGLDQPVPLVTGYVAADYEQAGRILADWVISKTNGNVNALVLTTNQAISTIPLVQGIKDEFAKRGGPNVKLKFVDIAISDWATKIQTEVQSAIIADPTLNYVMPIYDGMCQFVVPAIETTQAADKVKVATFNGTPFAIDMVQQGKVEMDLGENLEWVSYGIMDHDMRDLAGLPAPTDEHFPLYIFDKTNAANAGTPAEFSKGYGGTSYQDSYRALWGLTK
jgi:ribose transport system substrate-binding protein